MAINGAATQTNQAEGTNTSTKNSYFEQTLDIFRPKAMLDARKEGRAFTECDRYLTQILGLSDIHSTEYKEATELYKSNESAIKAKKRGLMTKKQYEIHTRHIKVIQVAQEMLVYEII